MVEQQASDEKTWLKPFAIFDISDEGTNLVEFF